VAQERRPRRDVLGANAEQLSGRNIEVLPQTRPVTCNITMLNGGTVEQTATFRVVDGSQHRSAGARWRDMGTDPVANPATFACDRSTDEDNDNDEFRTDEMRRMQRCSCSSRESAREEIAKDQSFRC
jgi:hypothetical protein